MQSRYKITFHKPHLDSANDEKLQFLAQNYIAFWAGVPSLYRLFLQDIFVDLDECLFLGCDVVALKCVSEVFKYDLGDYFAIASENKAIHFGRDSAKISDLMNDFCKNFGRKYYFDPDMVLLNLSKMRQHNLSQKFYDYAVAHLHSPHKSLINAEEGIWHLGFEDNVGILPHCFCFTLSVKNEKGRGNLSDLPLSDIARVEEKHAVFVHYACLKPWYVNYARLDTKYYWRYRNLSPFKVSATKYCKFKIKRQIYFFKIFIAKIPLFGAIMSAIYRQVKRIFT
ncbi:glycosyltransferase [Helicobacter sp. 23-1044]